MRWRLTTVISQPFLTKRGRIPPVSPSFLIFFFRISSLFLLFFKFLFIEMEGDFTHLTHGFSHTPSVYSASNLDDDTTSIASSRLTRDRDNQTINDDDAFSEVNGDDTASVVGLATRRRGGGAAGDGDIEEDIETL